MNEFKEGMEAYYSGKDESDNPYLSNTMSYERWKAGWNHAFKKSIRLDPDDEGTF